MSVHVAALWNISDVVEEVEEDPDEGVCVFFPTSQSPPVPVFLDEKSTKSVYVVRAVPPVAYLRKAAREKEIATMRVSRSAVHQVAGITFLRGSVYSCSHNSIHFLWSLITMVSLQYAVHIVMRYVCTLYLRGGVTAAERNNDRGLPPLARGGPSFSASGGCPDSASEATGGVTRYGCCALGGEDEAAEAAAEGVVGEVHHGTLGGEGRVGEGCRERGAQG